MTTKSQQIEIFNKDAEIIKRWKKEVENLELKIIINNSLSFTTGVHQHIWDGRRKNHRSDDR